MTTLEISAIVAALAGTFTALAKLYRFGPFLDTVKPTPSLDNLATVPDPDLIPASPVIIAPDAPKLAQDESLVSEPATLLTPSQGANKASETLLWGTPKQAWHSVRVLCDNDGLSVSEKNLICAVIFQESRFKNGAICRNKDKQGNVTSSDWGICQVNDYWHCGKGKTFPSAEYVVAHPEEAVRWMLKMYRLGLLKLWVAYSSKAYQQWLPKTSIMWKLA